MTPVGHHRIVLHVARALFVVLLAAVGWAYLGLGNLTVAVALAVGVLFISIDILSPRRKLAIFAGTFFGLIVGIAIAYALSFAVRLLVDLGVSAFASQPQGAAQREQLVQFVNLVLGITCCYLAISFILQTKDDFRFIIPYVEFSKQTRGARPILLDTSVLIDGRVADIAGTGILESTLIVPRFVLDELQAIADTPDRLKRNRGRRGLDVLGKLQANKRVEVVLYASAADPEDDPSGVDQQLIALASELNGRVLTTDYNLNKVAQLRGVDVVNINELNNALRPVVLPGEKMGVKLIKPGEEPGQGVGYLEDGTMVVVEGGRGRLNEEVEFLVTSALQTNAGRMIFGRLTEGAAEPGRRSRQKSDAGS